MRQFWSEVREVLCREYGQEEGKRDRQKFEGRKKLADQLGLNHRTLKSFLNGHQIGLGTEALNELFLLYPSLHQSYEKKVQTKHLSAEQSKADTQIQTQLPLPFPTPEKPE